jgi:hypothetical protein
MAPMELKQTFRGYYAEVKSLLNEAKLKRASQGLFGSK